ncbi:MAG: hypothetical protein D8M58_16195 [Calditrichaeota bacterium]|nr:MAG: hypothetical protein DWQ03_07925 [Calditrichota bacterium]MBL1206947.1 hypothetical protein [Calditrichota bacterium]NOG46774.1 hypothetical protein [Calditrichota bacterium]
MIRVAVCLIILNVNIIDTGFLEQQKKYPRVRQAIDQSLKNIDTLFKSKGVGFPAQKIFLRVFKSEQKIELWAKSSKVDTFCQIKSYKFCSTSGVLGPKTKQGDFQIPEGFYHLNRFNPHSIFHLSLGINYPNNADRILNKNNNLGGDIFIHGDCVTIGCIPITNALIKELYVIAVYSKNSGQSKIPVHIYPAKMSQINLEKINRSFNDKHKIFWANLKDGFDYFEKKHKLPKIIINQSGQYSFK